MKNKKIFIIIFFLVLIISGAITYKAYGYYQNLKREEYYNEWADKYFFIKYTDDEKSFKEDELKVQAFYFNMEYGKSYTLEDLENAYYERNALFYDYMDTYFEVRYYPEELFDSLDIIVWEEYRTVFSHLTSEEQDRVMEIYLEEHKLVLNYYGDSRIKLCKLEYKQQKEFYKLYNDASYVLDDKKMETDQPFGGLKKYEKHLVITKIEGGTFTLENEEDGDVVTYVGTYNGSDDFEVGDRVYVEFYFYSFDGYKYHDIQFEKMEKE